MLKWLKLHGTNKQWKKINMEERALEVYRWILYRVNGLSKEEIKKLTFDHDWMEIESIREIIEDGKNFDEV